MHFICYTGRVHPEKGLVVLAEAVRRLREQDPAWRVRIVGDLAIERGGGGESYRAEILEAAGNPDAVEFVGAIREPEKLADAVRACRYYVYPSLAKQGEAFGIAPLEAMSHDVPVLISRNSGVSEVLTHALKCDFWDVDEMANKIVAVLRHSPLSRALRDGGRFELRRITWDGAARKCEDIYNQLVATRT